MSVAAVVAGTLGIIGCGLLVGGVYVLSGEGWALLTGAVPCLLLSVIIARGLK